MSWNHGCSDVDPVPVCHVEERADCESEALDLLVDPHPYPYLVRAVCSDRESEISDTSCGNEQGGWALP